MVDMTQKEIAEYLAEVRRGDLVVVRSNGRPQVSPVWFLEGKGQAFVMTDFNAGKMRIIRHNPAVALSVASDQSPFKYVVLNGQAQVVETDVAQMVERICVRYRGPARGVEYAKELLAKGRMKLIEILVTRVVGWKDEE